MPKALFNVNSSEATAPAIIEFENHSENANSYMWDFGDGNSSTDESPRHRYTSSGNYTITLKAMNEKKVRELKKVIQIAAPEICLVELTTEFGSMLLELYDETPLHRDNFLKLADEGYYDGLLFHRVMDGFMIQGGDPNSKDAPPGMRLGNGGPDYKISAEITPELVHIKGALAAARQGDDVNPWRESSGSQFYIVHGKEVEEEFLKRIELRQGITYSPDQKETYYEMGGAPFLDNNYTVFGKVIEGLDVIDKIAQVKTDRADRPIENVTMKIIVIK
ncbi:MAG: peptidylprolyl isomerase [Bacteroidia bacterium]|nr:peptidylprolyl isomerase [Bacteroidia bacterium]